MNLKFLAKFKNSTIDYLKLLKEVFRDIVMTHKRIFKWRKRFYEGQEAVEDDRRPS